MSRCNSECEVERSGGGRSPMTKVKGKEAKGSSEGTRIKKEKQKHTERVRICPYTAKCPATHMVASEEW